jgi:DnaK suppressor protein
MAPMQTSNDDQLRAARVELAQIERALDRLEAGTYGTCETCSEKVDTERLRVVPFAMACRRCAPER